MLLHRKSQAASRAPHSDASTGSGSSRQRPSATALRTEPGWSPISSFAAAPSAHTAATASSTYCTSMLPADRAQAAGQV